MKTFMAKAASRILKDKTAKMLPKPKPTHRPMKRTVGARPKSSGGYGYR